MEAKEPHRYSPEEYFQLDDAAPQGVRLEYFDGYIYLAGRVFDPSSGWEAARNLAGASPRHNQVKGNVETSINFQLRDRDCGVFSSDQRVEFKTKSGYVYPDVVVACKPEYEGVVLKNPQLLIEILSESTAEHDLTRKMEAYASMETMLEFWFVSTNEARIIQCFRTERGWGFQLVSDVDLTIRSEHVNLEVPLREVYRRIF